MNVLKSKKEQITLYYGKQELNKTLYNHTGIDIVKKQNELDYIIAAQYGKVIKTITNVKTRDTNKGYGNYIEIEHANGVRTRYCHLKYGSIKVKVNDIVKKGQVIAFMGDTGYTFGAHLHFCVIVNNKEVDPLPYLKDEKVLLPYEDRKSDEKSKKYVTGNYIVLTDVLNVRKGPSIEYDLIKYVNLSQNAKEQMKKIVNYPANGYVKNMEFTAYEIKEKSNEAWAKTPSGWVCLYKGNEIYCKKK